MNFHPASDPPTDQREVVLFTWLSDKWDWWQAYYESGNWRTLDGSPLIVFQGSLWADMPMPPKPEDL